MVDMDEKILFVDDDGNFLSANKRLLRSRYEVITADSGKQGIIALKENGPIAVVVSDFRMPEMNGVQFLSNARQITPDTVRILFTGQADMQAAIDAVNECNIFHFLTKPCENQTLIKVLNSAIEQYRLNKRNDLIPTEINKFPECLTGISPEEKYTERNELKDILAKGENNFVEFKSSLRWDYKANQTNKTLEYVVTKTISAFLNSDGGKLFIGVSDDGKILGIEKDKTTLGKKQGNDEFQQKLVSIINQYLGKEFHQFILIKIEKIDGLDVCIVEISKSNVPAFIKNGNKEEFYIRVSTTSQPMNIKEAIGYISSKWDKK